MVDEDNISNLFIMQILLINIFYEYLLFFNEIKQKTYILL